MVSGGRTPKKRAAPSQIGPRAKKFHSEKPFSKDEKPGGVKRSKPVTILQTEGSDIGSDEGGGLSEEEDEELADVDKEMVDIPKRDPNGGC